VASENIWLGEYGALSIYSNWILQRSRQFVPRECSVEDLVALWGWKGSIGDMGDMILLRTPVELWLLFAAFGALVAGVFVAKMLRKPK